MRSLIGWLEGLPIQGSTAFVVALAVLLTLVVCSITRNARMRWTAVVAGPFALAGCVYSLPLLFGADPSEQAAWAGVFIGIWSISGLCASALATLLWTVVTRERAQHQP